MLLAPIALAIATLAQDPKPQAPPAKPPEKAAPTASQPSGAKTLTRKLADGVEMTADFYELGGGAKGPIVVCCHKAKASRGEYRDIAPELVRHGANVLAVDLRAGGELNGVANATAASAALLKKPQTYADAYPDLVEAVKWARELRPESKVALVGSSYSASLALVYAGREPKGVDAVIAFSPGEYIKGWSVAADAKNIKVPVYITCASGPQESSLCKPIADAIDSKLRVMYSPGDDEPSTHGALTLVTKDPKAREKQWKGVLDMLAPLSK
jgi:dienelactone hydrolase